MAVHFTGPILYSGMNAPGTWWKDLPTTTNPDYTVLMDDFNLVAIDSTNNWTVVKDSGASVGIVADMVNGYVALTSTATTDNDGASIQGNEVFLPAAGKEIWFETRLQNNKVDQTDICVGLTQNFATNPENMLTASNRIVFQIDDGSAAIICKTEATDTETSTTTSVSLTNDVDTVLGFHVVGVSYVEFYINRRLVATHTTNIPATEMAVAAMSLSGDNLGTRATELDYLFCVATRTA